MVNQKELPQRLELPLVSVIQDFYVDPIYTVVVADNLIEVDIWVRFDFPVVDLSIEYRHFRYSHFDLEENQGLERQFQR